MYIIQKINNITGDRTYLHIVAGTDERVWVAERRAAEIYMDRIEAVESYRISMLFKMDDTTLCMHLHTQHGWVRYNGTDHDMHHEVQEMLTL